MILPRPPSTPNRNRTAIDIVAIGLRMGDCYSTVTRATRNEKQERTESWIANVNTVSCNAPNQLRITHEVFLVGADY